MSSFGKKMSIEDNLIKMDGQETIDTNIGSDISKEPKNPVEIIIKKDSPPVDWDKYIGQEVGVVYEDDNEIVSQNVTSLENMEDRVMAKSIKDFSTDAKQELGPGYCIGECGRWVVLGEDSHYSEIFDSGGIGRIEAKDALRSLTALADKHIGKEEVEEDLSGLVLLHTHPLDIAPLSPADIKMLRKIGGIIGDENYRLEIYAIPTNGEVVFNHRLSKEEIQQAMTEREQVKK